MQKIIIDTNVIVSALIQKSYPFQIVSELLLENKIQLCISKELFSEYFEVLFRPKFSRFPDFFRNAENILSLIESSSIIYNPTQKLFIISDEDDNMILELAEECSADFIITGNSRDFIFSSYKETKIVSPKEYWEFYKP